jgi:accessory gene regulator protein AgrB
VFTDLFMNFICTVTSHIFLQNYADAYKFYTSAVATVVVIIVVAVATKHYVSDQIKENETFVVCSGNGGDVFLKCTQK